MGHSITALVGTRLALRNLIEQFGPPAPTEINCGLVIVPLGELRLDLLTEHWEPVPPDFMYLNAGLEDGILSGLGGAPALYIETNYFGSIGGQSAAYFADGKVQWKEARPVGPREDDRFRLSRWFGFGSRKESEPINRGLAALGVPKTPEADEFETVGLKRFRSLETLGVYQWDDED